MYSHRHSLSGHSIDGAAPCCQKTANFPPKPSTKWATASPEAGVKEFEAVQKGACYCDWPKTNLNCASCQFCKATPRPQSYPFGPDAPLPNTAAGRAYESATIAATQRAIESEAQKHACETQGASRCQFGPRDWIAPTGARSVMIAPGVWTVLPNKVPPAVSINAYHHWRYIDDVYDNRKGKIFRGCNPGRAGQCSGSF